LLWGILLAGCGPSNLDVSADTSDGTTEPTTAEPISEDDDDNDATEEPDVDRIFFGLGTRSDNTVLNPQTDFSEDTEVVFASFNCEELDDETWTQVWYLKDEVKNRFRDPLEGKSGQCWVKLEGEDDKPLSSGRWKLELRNRDDELLKAGEFVVGEEDSTPEPTEIESTSTPTSTATIEPTAIQQVNTTNNGGGGLTTFNLWTDTPQGTIYGGQDRWLTFTSKEWEKTATLVVFALNVERLEMFINPGTNISWPPSDPDFIQWMGSGAEQGNRDQNDQTREFIWEGPVTPSTQYYVRLVNRGAGTITYCLATSPEKYSCP